MKADDDVRCAAPVDSQGNPLINGGCYIDRYGDTWRVIHGGADLEHIAWHDGRTYQDEAGQGKLGGLPVHPWREEVASAIRSYGPMTKRVIKLR